MRTRKQAGIRNVMRLQVAITPHIKTKPGKSVGAGVAGGGGGSQAESGGMLDIMLFVERMIKMVMVMVVV